ncbi:soluble lytic murein transglycosylase [Thermodesulfovibrio aggregans]|uniref:Soluble lytic murein transglycosylase n=1 Tax=Thermodesulfovibrio aggregans TaxID=86166 RepID=A0A0U9HSS1_9BACT|nr:transglycosylase SLT domain-containing protein [Thermodesulfovibrio aggregans]GAQ94794.1 soluble lytic murein transglycosylase [Thermodesulfovibrio aggregans]
MKQLGLLIALILFFFLPSSTLSQFSSIDYLIEGKKSLQSGNFQRAEEYLTKALNEFKEIGDYILLWRAKAYKEMNKYEEALKDIRELKQNYPKSPILKDARKEEIEIAKLLNLPELEEFYKSFINEYPEEIRIKYEYALYLKKQEKIEKARKIFKEIFVTASPYADQAEKELSSEDITTNDLIKKAKALNSSYQFKKAEKYLKEALNMKDSQKTEILSLLGYSLFMQKRYSEAADIFKNTGEHYWRARSLLRAKEYEIFKKELPEYIKSADQRISEVLINYANIKRRAGEYDYAIKILKMVVDKYPAQKENAMWYLAWNYYLMEDYDKAEKILQQLYLSYGKIKYLYWLEKINETKGVVPVKQYSIAFQQGDIYSYLFYMKGKISNVPEPAIVNYQMTLPKRVEILIRASFRDEAIKEIKALLKDNRNPENIPAFCKILNELGDYSTTVRLISKIPNKFSFSELLYPQAYKDVVLNASRKININPYLVFAIIREESRFDRFAYSPAGALGLMQLMPETAKREGKKIGIRFKKDSEIFEAEKNILIGSYYLKNLIEEFGSIVPAIAAYNAGEKAVQSWLRENFYRDIDEFMEDIPYAETKAYVQRVLVSYFEYLRINRALTQEAISKIIKVKGGNQ